MTIESAPDLPSQLAVKVMHEIGSNDPDLYGRIQETLNAALAAAPQPAPETESNMQKLHTAPDREALVEVIREAFRGAYDRWAEFDENKTLTEYQIDALLARGLRLPGGEETIAWAAKIILSQPKRPDSPVAGAFTVACAHLEDRECGAETTNEIIETFLKALAGEDN